MYLGIDQRGIIYETFGSGPFTPVWPRPVLSQATLIGDEGDWARLPPPSKFEGNDPLVFREDGFDPVTRTRRGRLYETRRATQPSPEYVIGDRSAPQIPLFVYQVPWMLLNERRKLEGLELALGTNVFASKWKIIAVEMVGDGEVLVTLRALSTYGVIPELAREAIPSTGLALIQRELSALADAAFRESPSAIVDRCRNVLMAVIAAWLEQQDQTVNARSLELADLAKKLAAGGKFLASNPASTIALLHARTKINVQQQKGVTAPTDEDAAMALHEVGAVLRELGFAR